MATGRRPQLDVPGSTVVLEPWDLHHLAGLVVHANHWTVARNMTDSFPHPYTEDDGRAWITACQAQVPARDFAITLDAEAVGGCGVAPYEGERRIVAEIGYWLGPDFWGRGIASAVLARLMTYAWESFPHIIRLEAGVFGWNPASARVLEKAGFQLDGRLRRSIVKGGEITDRLIYGALRR